MGDWVADPAETPDAYSANCASRAAEGFYVGALYGTVWGFIGRAYSSPVFPSTPEMGGRSPEPTAEPKPARGASGGQPARNLLRALGRSAAGYGAATASTAGVFGVFVGIVNAGTCACERFRGKKDWINNMCGGAAAGLSVALLSRHTRSPRMVAAHVAGAAAITSVVAIATGPPVGS